MKKSAGIIIILNNNKVLLAHPSNSGWKNSFSFPKGGIEKGEKKIDAAIRELREETSVVVTIEQIDNVDEPIIVNYVDKKGELFKRLYLYTVHIDKLSDIGLTDFVIPEGNLQIEEVDWAGFLTKEEADDRIFYRCKHLLDIIE